MRPIRRLISHGQRRARREFAASTEAFPHTAARDGVASSGGAEDGEGGAGAGQSTAVTALATVEHLLRYSPPRNHHHQAAALLWVMRTCHPEELRQLACGTVKRRFDRVRSRFRSRTAPKLVPLRRPLLVFIIRAFRPDDSLYSDMIRLLTDERIGDLDVQSKCAIIKSLQISKIRGDFGYDNSLTDFEGESVRRLFESVTGPELTVLKNMLNEGGNRFNLHQLLFSAVPVPCREAILSHFEADAASVILSKRRKPIKVLSDIDDTLFSSFLDKRYPKHIVYPGVRQFLAELTRDNLSLSSGSEEMPFFVADINGNNNDAARIASATTVSVAEQLADLHSMVAETVARIEGDSTPRNPRIDVGEDIAMDAPIAKDGQDTSNTIRKLLFPSIAMAKWHEMWVNFEDRENSLSKSRGGLEMKGGGDLETSALNKESETEEMLDSIIDLDVVVEENTPLTSIAAPGDKLSSTFKDFEGGALLASALHAESHETELADVTYITARPHGIRGVVAAVTRRRLRKAGLSSKPNVMLGDMKGLLGNKRIAQKKFRNFEEFAQLFPEYHFVLVGDSGQGDAALGALILEDFGPDTFRAAFIHDISPDRGTTGDGMTKLEYETVQGFEFYRTYVGSAVRAHQDGLFHGSGGEGLLRVCQSVEAELREINFRETARGRRMQVDRWKDLLADIERAQKVL